MTEIPILRGAPVEECPGTDNSLQKTYLHEEDLKTGMWAYCPDCERWYQGPYGVPVPYAHTKDGWITEGDDTVGVTIRMIWPNYSIPARAWKGAAQAWSIVRKLGLEAGGVEPIGGMPGAPGEAIRTEEVGRDRMIHPGRFAQATARGIQKTQGKIKGANRAARRAAERQANRRRHGR